MKKTALLFSLLFVVGLSTQSIAQSNFDKGTGVAQFTIGFPQVIATGALYKTRIPAMAIAYDHCFFDDLIDGNASVGIGGILGIAGSKFTNAGFFGTGTYSYNYTYILFGARGTFHYQLVDDLDTYAGVLVGGYGVNASYEGPSGVANVPGADGGAPIAGGFVGARYFFNDNLAVMGEVGYGIAILNVGLAYRFQ